MQRLDVLTLRSKEQSKKYLVGTLDRFNDGKLAEVKDRVPHNYGVDYTHTVSGLLDD
jgi:hypothetical protein